MTLGPVCRRRAALRQVTRWRPHRQASGRSGAAVRRAGSGCGRQGEGYLGDRRAPSGGALHPIEPSSADSGAGKEESGLDSVVLGLGTGG